MAVTLAAVGDIGISSSAVGDMFSSVAGALSKADMRFAQVERLYSERKSFQHHTGAYLLDILHEPSRARVFRDNGFDVLSLASNHMLDWGTEAVEGTVDTFAKLQIPTIGAGRNIAEARRPAFIERNGVRIAFLGYCSVLPPQSWATDERAGCAPLRADTYYKPFEYQPGAPAQVVTVPDREDLEALRFDVRAARAEADHVVVSMHWGLHFTTMPQQYQPVVAHAVIDAGASAVLGHHPHQLQAIEVYKDCPIFYSLGNFIFKPPPASQPRRAFCMPEEKTTCREVYSIEIDPGHVYDFCRHWSESGIAYLEFDATRVKRVTFKPAYLDDAGRPCLLSPQDPQFDTIRKFLEWAGRGVEGGLTSVGVDGDRYVISQP